MPKIEICGWCKEPVYENDDYVASDPEYEEYWRMHVKCYKAKRIAKREGKTA